MSSNAKLTAAILIISTTASKDPSQDATGPILRSAFSEANNGQWTVVETKIVGDNVLEIQRAVLQWADSGLGDGGVNLIVASGGTGFTEFDNTPEVRLVKSGISLKFGMIHGESRWIT